MRDRLHALVLRIFRRLPMYARRWLVRAIAPKYTVGAICLIERADGRILLVRQSYRGEWGIPGGLVKRREDIALAAVREVFEEVGLRIELLGEPAVVVAPHPQRVDVVFRARLVDDADARLARPSSPEIVEVGWFRQDELPKLQRETAQSLVTLARSARAPQAPTLATDRTIADRFGD